MGRRKVIIALALVMLCASGVAWIVLSQAPSIDSIAALSRLARDAQSAGLDGRNGWPDLVALGREVDGIVKPIRWREEEADEAAKRSGVTPEAWARQVSLFPNCTAVKSPRDDRLYREAMDAITRAGIFDRLRDARTAPVFLADVQSRSRNSHSDEYQAIHSVPRGRMYALAEACIAAMFDAASAGEYSFAIERLRDYMAVIDAMGRQPGGSSWYQAASFERLIGETVVWAAWNGGLASAPLCEAALEVWPGYSLARFGAGMEGLRLECRASVELTAERKHDSAMGMLESAIPWYGFDSAAAIKEIEVAFAKAQGSRTESMKAVVAARRSGSSRESVPLGKYRSVHDLTDQFYELVIHAQKLQLQQSGDLIVVALNVYTSRHGAPPATLGALVPAILPELPSDPVAPDGRFRYIPGPTMADVVVYSVGFDGADDGGVFSPEVPLERLNTDAVGIDVVFWPPYCASDSATGSDEDSAMRGPAAPAPPAGRSE